MVRHDWTHDNTQQLTVADLLQQAIIEREGVQLRLVPPLPEKPPRWWRRRPARDDDRD